MHVRLWASDDILRSTFVVRMMLKLSFEFFILLDRQALIGGLSKPFH